MPGLSLVITSLVFVVLATLAFACPKVCFCNIPSRIVYCSRRGLKSIPDGIPSDALQLNLNVNGFESGLIGRGNVSRFVQLEHLYLSECELESIEVGAFSDLVRLQWLDLSNNRLKVIGQFTFQGLVLQHLFLNGNRNIRLVRESFEGLSTTGLYLHDCSLSELNLDDFQSLNSSLRYLWLNGNGLERIDWRFQDLFSGFLHLRLGFNPLHCNCETVWLKEFYDQKGDIFKGAMAPSCLTPHRLRGRYFNELLLQDFRCLTPMFTKIEAHLTTRQGVIKCAALGEPAPSLYWIQPSGKTTKYDPEGGEEEAEEAEETEAVLPLSWDEERTENNSPAGMYICVANNEAGNVTLTVNLPWPQRSRTAEGHHHHENDVLYTWSPLASARSVRPSFHPRPSSDSNVVPASNIQYRLLGDSLMLYRSSTSTPSSSGSSTGQKNWSSAAEVPRGLRVGPGNRLFTCSELTLAVVGTHLCTLVVCFVFAVGVYRLRLAKQYPVSSFSSSSSCSQPPRSTFDPTTATLDTCGGHLAATTGVGSMPTESIYLNGAVHHPLRSYVQTPDQHLR